MVFYKPDTGSYRFFSAFLYGELVPGFSEWPNTSHNSIIGYHLKNNFLLMWTGPGGYNPIVYYFNFNDSTKGYIGVDYDSNKGRYGQCMYYGTVNDTVIVGTTKYDNEYASTYGAMVLAFNTKTYERKSYINTRSSYTVKNIYGNSGSYYYGMGNMTVLINTLSAVYLFDPRYKVLYIISDTFFIRYNVPINLSYAVEKNNKIFLYPDSSFTKGMAYLVYNQTDNTIEYYYI
jgi:hypothetical protein